MNRLSDATALRISTACWVRHRKKPGMSRVLIGSISNLMLADSRRLAASRRFDTNVARASAASTPAGTIPARQFTCVQPSAVAYSIA